MIDGNPAGSIPIAGGLATLTISTLSGGSHTVVANYQGSIDFLGSTGSVGHDVTKASTTTTLVSSVPSSTFGQQVVFTATVSSLAPLAVTGDVVFSVDGVPATTVPVVGGQAVFSTSALMVGLHDITATYQGGVDFLSSSASIPTFVVAKATTTTTLTAVPNPSVVGQPVTLTATVTSAGGIPDGTVEFSLPSGPQTVPLTNGVAELVVPSGAIVPFPLGSSPITATYSGSANFEASSGTLVPAQQVNQASTTTTVTAAPSPSVLGQSVTFTITVAPVPPGSGTPTGSVSVSIDGGAATVIALSGGTATLTTSALGVGDHTVQASYAGNADYAASSASVNHTVAKAATTLTLTSSPDPSQPGETVTFTATVTDSAPETPSGSVSFSIDGAPAGNVAIAGGVATLTINTLGAGTYNVDATYSGDADFAASAGGDTHTVVQGDTTTTLTITPEPSIFGEIVTFSVDVDPVAPATMGATRNGRARHRRHDHAVDPRRQPASDDHDVQPRGRRLQRRCDLHRRLELQHQQ